MAQKHLSEDEIKYVVSAETSKAQQELHKLTQETKDLAKEERIRKQAMVELEAQGKKNTADYKNLQKETKTYSDQIKINNKQIDELSKKMDVNGLTMVQLKKRARDLQTQLDNTSKAANPEEYNKTEQALNKVKNRMGELKTNGQSVSGEMGTMESWMGKLKAAAIAFVTVKLAEYLKDIAMKAYDTRKEFAQYEAVLRNTLGSQEKAADAMGRLQQLAADTPFSLKEWTEGYIKLVNRGIKPTNEELVNMGDIAASQGKTLDQFVEALLDAMTGENERMKEFGIRANAQGDKVKYTFKGVTTEVAKSDDAIVKYILSLGKLQGVSGSMSTQMEELGGMASNLGDNMDAFFNKVGKKLEPFFKGILSTAGSFFTTLSRMLSNSTEKYTDHYNKMVQVESALPPLLSRYNELILKTSRSASENKELTTTIQNISKLIPGAATAFDKYGNAIAISTTKVKEFLKNQRALLAFENKKAIEDTQKEVDKYQKQLDNLKAQQKQGGATRFTPGGMFGGSIAYIDKTVMSDIEANIAKTSEMLNGAKQSLAKLNGQTIEDGINAQKQEIAARNQFNKMTKSQLDKWIADEKNASNEYIDIAKEVAATKNNSNVKTDTSDPYAVALKKLDSSNEAEVNKIRLTGREKQQTEFEIESLVLSQEEEYYKKRISMLQKFSESAKTADKRADYAKQLVDTKAKLMDVEVDKEKQTITELQRLRDADLAKEEGITSESKLQLTDKLKNKTITEKQASLAETALNASSAQTKLAINERYYNDVNDLTIKNEKLRQETVKTASDNLASSQQQAANASIALDKSTVDYQLSVIQDNEENEMLLLTEKYANRLITEKAYQDQSLIIESNYMSQRIALNNLTEDQIKDYREKIAKLKIDQNEKENKKIEDRVKKTVDSYKGYGEEIGSSLQSVLSGQENLLSAFGESVLDILFDVLTNIVNQKIAEATAVAVAAQAKAAAEAAAMPDSVATFGATAAARTAVIGGIIMAALATAKGALKGLISRKSNSSKSSSSSSTDTYNRVATGRESGGYVDVTRAQDGKQFNAEYDPNRRGYIDKPTVIVGEGAKGQSKEWVASNAAVSNPTIAPIIDMIDRAQRAGTIRTLDLNAAMKARLAGYSGGGNISTPSAPAPANTIINNISSEDVKTFSDAINNLVANGIPASVLLSDLERKQQLRDQSRKIGSKK